MKSILQDWVIELGLRHQGVLLTVIRGFDGWSKHAPQKPLIREMRGLILNPFDERELKFSRGFMTRFPDTQAKVGFQFCCENIDGLPVHYIMHVAHACEIIGYCHPDAEVRDVYRDRYRHICHKFHMHPESLQEMEQRLTEDRISAGTVET